MAEPDPPFRTEGARMTEILRRFWLDKITSKMDSEKSPTVEFVGGEDFKMADLVWIDDVLIPLLEDQDMEGSVRNVMQPGDKAGEATGRIFAVSLGVDQDNIEEKDV